MEPEPRRCARCGGALQRVPDMPGHLVCGSGHLVLEKDADRAHGAIREQQSRRAERPRRP